MGETVKMVLAMLFWVGVILPVQAEERQENV